MRLAPLLPLTALLAAGLLSCRADTVTGASGGLRATPQEVVFAKAWRGRSAVASLQLHNAGRATVAVQLTTDAPFSVTSEVELPGGETAEVEVRLLAEATGPHEGEVLLRWESNELRVPLRATVGEPTVCLPVDCHAVRFDEATGECVSVLSADGTSCGAQDVCLVGGVCRAGECVGATLDCDDGNACTRDVCERGLGCRYDDVSDACPASLDPCQAPRCDPRTGCALTPAPDGTACGPNDCTTARVCITGACVARASPEGSTCAAAATCRAAGVCRGQRCEVPPPSPMTPRWRYEPPPERTLAFTGAVDDDGTAYAAERWRVSDTDNVTDSEVVALVALSRDGVVRFKEPVAFDCPSCLRALALDVPGRRAFFLDRLALQARSLDDGRLLWRRDVTAGIPLYDTRPDGGGVFWPSTPMLVGDTLVGLQVSEGSSDHHAYVRTFDRATGAPAWDLHKKGHLYGVGVDGDGELWLSSANCWAAAGEMVRVAPTGVTRAARFHEFYPTAAYAGFGVGRFGNATALIDRQLGLRSLAPFGVPANPTAVLMTGEELITADSAAGLLATHVGTGAHRFAARGLTLGASPDFQLIRDGGVAWTGAFPDGGVLGAIDGQGAPLLTCPLPVRPESPTAIVRGRAYVFARGGLSVFTVPELELEASGWTNRLGSPARANRAR